MERRAAENDCREKKCVFCRSSVVGHGEARWGATWNAGVIPRATDYLPERSEDKRYFVTKCSMRDRDGERERGRKRRGSFDKLWLASPPHWSGFLLAQSCNRGGEEENVRKVELTGENAWTRGKREEKKKKKKMDRSRRNCDKHVGGEWSNLDKQTRGRGRRGERREENKMFFGGNENTLVLLLCHVFAAAYVRCFSSQDCHFFFFFYSSLHFPHPG